MRMRVQWLNFRFYSSGKAWLSFVTDFKSWIMENKNCLVIERNEEPELREPRIVSFGYWNFEIAEKITRSGKLGYNIITLFQSALYCHVDTLGIDFMRYDNILVLFSRPFYQSLDLGLETWWPRCWSWSRDLVTNEGLV